MPKKPPEGSLFIAVESEDWIAIRGTGADLEKLGQLLIDFARSGSDCAHLDSPGPLFRTGSLGITLYRESA
jgi:hypothetical protein